MTDEVVIIGAGRSGTNALRDALCLMDQFHTWPCDEINYIWRCGNRSAPTDALARADARPEVVRRVRTLIDRRRAKAEGRILVEKTCANSLRVGFVDEIVPAARFVHIVRDGRDVVASARQRWSAPLNLRYLVLKARFVPLADVAYYGLRYLGHRVARLRSDDARLPTWGPRFPGMDELVRTGASLEEVCAHQWAACVGAAREQLAELPRTRVLEIRYEALVATPAAILERVSSFAGADVTIDDLAPAAAVIRKGSVGSWKLGLDERSLEATLPIILPFLDELGYR